MKPRLFLLCSLLFLLTACQKDKYALEQVIEESPPIILVENTLKGQVQTAEGNPIVAARVFLGNHTTQTDEYGNFKFAQKDVPKSGGIVRVEAPGFFPGSSFIQFTPDGTSFTRVQMTERGTAKRFSGRAGGLVRPINQLSLNFPPNSVRQVNGTSYQGEVEVFTQWIPSTEDEFGGDMPGALVGIDEEAQQIALSAFGMFGFELETPDGLPLELAAGKEVEVTLEILPELATSAPNGIPFWSFDLEQGRWLRSGICFKEDNHYSFQIGSSGYWSCSEAVPAICLSRRFFQPDSTYAAYLKVEVEDLTNNFTYWGYTDSTGNFCGAVPADRLLQLSVFDHCDNLVFSEEVGPFSSDQELEDTYLPVTVEEYFVVISGQLATCDGRAPNGHMAVRYPGHLRLFSIDFDGSFTLPIGLKCLTFPELEITGYNLDDEQITTTIVHTSNQDLNLGEIKTCEVAEDEVRLEVDGVSYWLSPTQFATVPNTIPTRLVLQAETQGGRLELTFEDYTGVGQYNNNVIFKLVNEFETPAYPVLNGRNGILTRINSDDGQYIEGQLSGTVRDNADVDRNVSAIFKIRKAL